MKAMTSFFRCSAAAAAALAALLSAGCGEAPTRTDEPTTATVRVTADVHGTLIATLVVEVTAPDIPTPLAFNLVVLDGVASGTLQLPVGRARTITVTAMDNQGTVTHDGSVTIDVITGQNPSVQVTLHPRWGEVPITVTFGAYSVVVTPAAVSLASGDTVRLAVTVTRGDSVQVSDPAVQWATTRPTVAAVSASGLVTGAAAGTALIVVSYKGVAAMSTVSVSAGAPAKLAFTAQPTTAGAGLAMAPAVQVTIQDAQGNVVPGAANDVSLAITEGSGTAGAVLGGTLTKGAVNAVATFADLTVDLAGSGYSFTASASGLTAAVSMTFAVISAGVTNGGFESGPGVGWAETSTHGYELIVDPSTFGSPASTHSGTYLAWLGGSVGENATLSQQVQIPPGATTLRFYLVALSEESQCGYDYAEVRVNGVLIASFPLCGTIAAGWTERQYDITGFAGELSVLLFSLYSDDTNPSSFLIDDVSIF